MISKSTALAHYVVRYLKAVVEQRSAGVKLRDEDTLDREFRRACQPVPSGRRRHTHTGKDFGLSDRLVRDHDGPHLFRRGMEQGDTNQ
jgi:hypothetical protein